MDVKHKACLFVVRAIPTYRQPSRTEAFNLLYHSVHSFYTIPIILLPLYLFNSRRF